jgi:hypothetical protein
MWFAASSAKSSRTGARSTVARPSAPELPSESSASNACAIDPSSKSKPEGGRVENLGGIGRREGRLAGTLSPGIDTRSASEPGLLRGAASASAAAPVRFEGGGRAESGGDGGTLTVGADGADGAPGTGGRTAAMRVESIRTAAFSVELSACE